MNNKWRLIDSGFSSGRFNMEEDERLFDNFCKGEILPVFRVYGWRPPAFSIGRFQNPEELLDLEACKRDGMDIVKRITGGGVIFHDDEVTYSLVCSERDIGKGISVKESYKRLCSFLILFYKKLGLKASFAVENGAYSRSKLNSSFCFSGREEYDIVINGKKIGGNAQRRKRDVIFQHGSIPISIDRELPLRYLKEKPKNLEFTCLREEGVPLNFSELKELLLESFKEVFFLNS